MDNRFQGMLLQPSIYQGGNPYIFGNPQAGTYGPTNQPPAPQAQNQYQSPVKAQDMMNFTKFKPGAITDKVNAFGTNLGFSGGGLQYTGVGPGALPWQQPGMVANPMMAGQAGVGPATGSLGTTATLGQTLGAAGIGAFAGSFLGKIGGNSTGGSIGGGAGAAIGMMAGGPIGAVVGGLIGGIGGGFFGSGKPSATVSEFAGYTSARDGFAGNLGFGSKNSDTSYGSYLGNEMDGLVKGMSQYLDTDFAPNLLVMGGYNSKYGAYYRVGDEFDWFDSNSEASKNAAQDNALIRIARASGVSNDRIVEAIANLNGKRGSGEEAKKVGDPSIPDAVAAPQTSFGKFLEDYKAKYGPQSTIPDPSTTTPTA